MSSSPLSGFLVILTMLAGFSPGRAADVAKSSAWARAAVARPPMTVAETREFMKRLAEFVLRNHLKKDENSPQRGLIYEYFWVPKKGTPQQWIEGEGLDTMHDGAWFAAAMVQAFRATGDPFYKEVLTKWQMPFYLKMLNHSDELFSSERNDGRPGDDRAWRASKEWLLQGREKGFVPYWWDDGASVSLEMTGRKDGDEHVNFAAHNDLAGQPNPQKRLSGYSHGSSNHLAQDLGVMLEQTWLLFRESSDASERALAAVIADAARNLEDCRTRHGSPGIPAVKAAFALSNGDAAARKALPDESWKSLAMARSDWRRALFEFKPDVPVRLPPFADDQEYHYYAAIARAATLTESVAVRLIYDAFTLPKLYRSYCDNEAPPPGINIFDLHPYNFVNGHPTDYRSERKGPSGRPRPVGSRFGPQNMVVTGWALQAIKANPGIWDRAKGQITIPNFFPAATESEVKAEFERELGSGLRTWQAVFDEFGYIPTSIGNGLLAPGVPSDELSDTGGYAHLISAGAQWIFHLEGKRDWEEANVPAVRD
jgi:hypothetical protein